MISIPSSTFSMLAMLTPPDLAEYASILPGSILCVAALLVILLDVVHTNETDREYLSYASAVAFGVSLLSVVFLWDKTVDVPTFFGMLYLDHFGLFFAGVVSVVGMLSSLATPGYIRSINMDRAEIYILMLFSAAGMIFMAQSADLLSIFLSLEVMSIPLYCVAAFNRTDARSAESGIKYFILGAFSTALTLYGVALIYGITGTTNLEAIQVVLAQIGPQANLTAFEASTSIVTIGSFLVLSGFVFKIAAAPFHVWTPDVYTGTPTPATGFMATGVKAASFAVILRLVLTAFDLPSIKGGFFGYGWIDILFAFACFSVVIGNFAAMAQSNVKRMLAYSSIAHAGYILVGLVAANANASFFLFNDSVLFYLATYAFTTLGAFGVLSYLSRFGKPVETYEDLKGVGLSHPGVGLLMGVFMFSSAGIPPTAGFLAKFYVIRAAVSVGAETGEMSFIGLSILALLSSVCGVYYYLKVLVSMYMSEPSTDVEVTGNSGARAGLIIAAISVMVTGVYPQPLIDLAQQGVVGMVGPRQMAEIQEQGAEELRLRQQGAVAQTAPTAQAQAALNPTIAPPQPEVKRDAVARPVEPTNQQANNNQEQAAALQKRLRDFIEENRLKDLESGEIEQPLNRLGEMRIHEARPELIRLEAVE